ncbi:GNAT family N-acetyltransferase [Rhodococcus aerolatus]
MTGRVEVTDVPERRRYEATIGGERVGFAAYEPRGTHRTFTHTEVDPAWEGHGVGGALARAALDDVRARSLTLTPRCPFIAAYLERHPDDLDLVADPPT